MSARACPSASILRRTDADGGHVWARAICPRADTPCARRYLPEGRYAPPHFGDRYPRFSASGAPTMRGCAPWAFNENGLRGPGENGRAAGGLLRIFTCEGGPAEKVEPAWARTMCAWCVNVCNAESKSLDTAGEFHIILRFKLGPEIVLGFEALNKRR